MTDAEFTECHGTRCTGTRRELCRTPDTDRSELFAELAHPAFMAISSAREDDLADTYAMTPPVSDANRLSQDDVAIWPNSDDIMA